ncbi:MAG: exo-alpha-sialidase [Clostridia bacterium]|nr:exo-alpha-sialidase [Clostridia bacterium]
MKGSNKPTHRPYFPPNVAASRREQPYICRLAPGEFGFDLEWLPLESTGPYNLCYGVRGSEDYQVVPLLDSVARVRGLEPDTEYEVFILAKGVKSATRLLRTGAIPEGATVINYLHPEDPQYDFSGRYLCSPSLVRTKSGRLVAGMDLFGPRMAQNLTLLFKSEDEGKTWHYLTDLYPFYWGSLFTHRGVLYMLGLTTEYGNLQIAASYDEGESWTAPVTLFYGSNVLCRYGGAHRAPMHVVEEGGRLYTSSEYGSWEMGSHLPTVLSIDAEADLLNPENWSRTELLHFEGPWKEAAGTQGDTMEGNIVRDHDGKLYNFLRWKVGSYLRMRINEADPDAPLEFAGIVPAPVSNSMFRVIPLDGKYIWVTNRVTERVASFGRRCQRSVLSVLESRDNKSFSLLFDVVNWEDEDPEYNGFQYPAHLLEGDTLSLVVRSGFNGTHNAHDANYSLFFRFEL